MTSDREGIPNFLVGAQHSGAPVVATDVGGVGEGMEPGRTGRAAPMEAGAPGYARAVLQVLNDARWREAARRRGPALAHEKFSLERVIDELLGHLGMS